MFPATASTGLLTQRTIDPNAIDITSLKGQFAWEKIPQCDTYMPVIFRGDTKYFCVRMLRKILPEFPEDVLRRSYQYHYRKPIDIYSVTACEVDLLNRINSHHSRWTYSRQPFTALDEIVRVTDFLPFYEHLRGLKSSSGINQPVQALRQILPQSRAQPNLQRSSESTIGRSAVTQRQSTAPQASHTQIQPYALSTNSRPTVSASNGRQPKSFGNPYAVVLPSRALQPPMPLSTHLQQSTPVLMNNMINCANTVPPSNVSFVSNTMLTPMVPSTNIPSSSPTTTSTSPNLPSSIHYSPSSSSSPILPSTAPTVPVTTNRKLSTSSSTAPLPPPQPPTPSSTTSSSSSSSSSTTITSNTSSSTKLNRLHCGWLQVNKLYTPYISTSATNHHLYKLPVSLLTFYDLLKLPSTETIDPTNESLLPHEQTTATSQELELINELCAKQNIKPFDIDTKLIQLSAFYRYTTANMIFVKELPLEEPKASICKDWSSIVQINGGICRLRHIKTLHEQTVPFIGSNLLKNFLLSPHCLSNASLTKPTSSESEFLQLILFFSNLSMSLLNCQLIDIESVKKEYNVDLILLFNDKFPVNVLNYQQGSRLNTTSGTIIPTTPTAPTNTIAESTPPPSPPSSPTNQPQSNGMSQLQLTASTAAAAQNRYHKTIQFRGHTLTAFVCSGIGPNTQRECVSIRSLCNILYPDSPTLEKLEMKMLRLLRSKNINRFRPQNQSSLGFTRLIDVKDAEKHWDYLEQEMRTVLNGKLTLASDTAVQNCLVIDNQQTNNHSSPSTVTNDDANPNTESERVESSEPVSTKEANKGEKRPLEETLDEEDIPVLERINKRVRFAAEENHNTVTDNTRDTTCSLINGERKSDDHSTDKPTEKRPIKIILPKMIKKRALPSNRINRNTRATWTKRYNIEDFCILLDKCDPELIPERD
ncbi:unnamed protein product [Adineta ricciae]|uniref:Uncharacterized protein n=1 Tax=Adineta ricciae TaxID=249248 RepID=A0A815Z336_ADIRI|nr:unnamed protein product [Adineta ricciae]